MDLKYRDSQRSPGALSNNSDELGFPSDEELENGDERIQNDLLNEICTDIGIKDSMDLDFYDMATDSVIQFEDHLAASVMGAKTEAPSSLQDLYNMQNWTPISVPRSSQLQSTPATVPGMPGPKQNFQQGQVPEMKLQDTSFSHEKPMIPKPNMNIQVPTERHNLSLQGYPTSQGHRQGQQHLNHSFQDLRGMSSYPGHSMPSRMSQVQTKMPQMQQNNMQIPSSQGQMRSTNSQGHRVHFEGHTPVSNPSSKTVQMSRYPQNSTIPASTSQTISFPNSPSLSNEPGAAFFSKSMPPQSNATEIQRDNHMHSGISVQTKTDSMYSKSKSGRDGAQHSALSTPSVHSPVSLSTSPFSLSPNKVSSDMYDRHMSQLDQSSTFCLPNFCDSMFQNPNDTLTDFHAVNDKKSDNTPSSILKHPVRQNDTGQKIRSNSLMNIPSSCGKESISPARYDYSCVSSPAPSKPPSPQMEDSESQEYDINPVSAMSSRMPSPATVDPSPFVSRWTSPTTAAPSPSKEHDCLLGDPPELKREPHEDLKNQMACSSPSVSSTLPDSALSSPVQFGERPMEIQNQRKSLGQDMLDCPRSPAVFKPGTPKMNLDGSAGQENDPRQRITVRRSSAPEFPSSPMADVRSPIPRYPGSPLVPDMSAKVPVCDTTTGDSPTWLQSQCKPELKSTVFKVPNAKDDKRYHNPNRSFMPIKEENARNPNRTFVPGTVATKSMENLSERTPDALHMELKSPHDAGYHSGDLSSNASRSTSHTPVSSVYSSMENISTNSSKGQPISFSQLLQSKLNKVDGYNRYPISSTTETKTSSSPTLVPRYRDKNVPTSQVNVQNKNMRPSLDQGHAGLTGKTNVDKAVMQSQKDQAWFDNFFSRSSRKSATYHFPSGNSSLETSPTRNMPRKQQCVNPIYGEYKRDRSPIKMNENIENDIKQEANSPGFPTSQNVDASVFNISSQDTKGVVRMNTSMTSQCKMRGITPLAEFVQKHKFDSDPVRLSSSSSRDPSQEKNSQNQPVNQGVFQKPEMFKTPQNPQKTVQFARAQYNQPRSPFSVPSIPDNQFSETPQAKMPFSETPQAKMTFSETPQAKMPFSETPQAKVNHPGMNFQGIVCSTPQTDLERHQMMQMNKKWPQAQQLSHGQRPVPYPQGHAPRHPGHFMQQQNSNFQNQNANFQNQNANFQNQSANFQNQNANFQNQSANFQSQNAQMMQGQMMSPYVQNNQDMRQNVGAPNTPNYQCNYERNAQYPPQQGYLPHGNMRSMPPQMNQSYQNDFMNASTFSQPNGSDTPSNFSFQSNCGMPSPGPNFLGPSQNQHWLVQKYKQRGPQSDNWSAPPTPSDFSKPNERQYFPQDQSFQGMPNQAFRKVPNKPPSTAPNICVDKNSNFGPVQHDFRQQNSCMEPYNNFREPVAPPPRSNVQIKQDHFDDPLFENESFGSMVTNVSNTTPHPGYSLEQSSMVSTNGTQEASQNFSTSMCPSPFNQAQSSDQNQFNGSLSPLNHSDLSDDALTSIVIGSQQPEQWDPKQGLSQPNQVPSLPHKLPNTASGNAKQGFIRNLVCDKSKAFRSHPLFPLLRDLIIADMNFNSPTFPFRLIANLPSDFNKLLHNYLQRNRTNSGQDRNAAVEGVIMDALKYAHQSLMEKIAAKKRELGEDIKEQKATSVIEEFCEKFDQAVRNSFQMGDAQPGTSSSAAVGQIPRSVEGDMNSDTGSMKGGQNKKHPILPKEAVTVMMMWLRDHRDNPYPSEEEKDDLLRETKISMNQLNYWFTNARRRILPKWAAQENCDFQEQVTSTS